MDRLIGSSTVECRPLCRPQGERHRQINSNMRLANSIRKLEFKITCLHPHLAGKGPNTTRYSRWHSLSITIILTSRNCSLNRLRQRTQELRTIIWRMWKLRKQTVQWNNGLDGSSQKRVTKRWLNCTNRLSKSLKGKTINYLCRRYYLKHKITKVLEKITTGSFTIPEKFQTKWKIIQL